MKFDELAILLNSHTFQDFPVHATGPEAESLLTSWTALWHPRLVAHASRMPTWYRSDLPPQNDRPRLLALPQNQLLSSPDLLEREVTNAGGQVVRDALTRDAFFAQLGPEFSASNASLQDQDLAADFFALGFAYLQVEMLTRHMRQSSRIQQTDFEQHLLQAARAAVQGEQDAARQGLQTCFDFLSQERDHYYAVDVYLLDVALLARPQCGAALVRQLTESPRTNLIMTADLLGHLEQHEPASLTAVRQSLGEGRLSVLGGEWSGWPLQLLSTETARAQLEQGRAEYLRVVGAAPRVFGRYRFGLNPSLPALLHFFGYQGVFHATLDGGRFPEATQSKSRWEGDGQLGLDAIMRAPLDATQTTTFLNLAASLSESMDMDHIATRCFAHWTGQMSDWYRDLQRASRYTRALGRFVTAEEYFQETYDPGLHDRFSIDDYHSPYLQQEWPELTERPISAIMDYWRHQILLQHWTRLTTLCLLVRDSTPARDAANEARTTIAKFHAQPLDRSWNTLLADVPAKLQWLTTYWLEAWSQAARSSTGKDLTTSSVGSSNHGLLVANPLGFPRRVGPLSVAGGAPNVAAPIYAADDTLSSPAAIIDVPAMGVALVRPASSTKRRGKQPPPLAEPNWLRNEFLEAQIDPQTGTLRGIKDYGARTNRLSQQLAYRWMVPPATGGYYAKPDPVYSRMVAESSHVAHSDTLLGRVETSGRLVNDQGHTLARFQQAYQLIRGSRTLEIEIDIQPETLPDGDPWDNYYACRFAWSNEASDLTRSLADGLRGTKARRFESPLLVQIDDGQHNTVLVTGGLPFHRCIGTRMLDTLLIVRNESQRKFRLGIAIDPKQAFREAIGFLAPNITASNHGHIVPSDSAWLFHVDARHVMVNDWLPIWEDDRLAGVRMRLVEVDGRSGPVLIRSFRPMKEARKVDAAGQTVQRCDIDQDGIRLTVSSHEITEIEAKFA